MQKARGSAIVIAMLLVTAVGAVAFTFGKVLNLQISNETLYENGVGAYYSAESGLEEGFLRYRYDQNAQVPATLTAQNWLSQSSQVIRSNLTTPTITPAVVTKITPVTDISSQYYDLRMSSAVGSSIGNVYASPLDPNYHIVRDGTKEIDLGNIFSNGINLDINLSLIPTASTAVNISPTVSGSTCTLVEAKLELQPASGSVVEKKTMLRNTACNYGNVITDLSTTIGYTLSNGVATINNLKSQMAPATFYNQATLFLKPIGADIDYALAESPPSILYPLSGAVSVITATGYYGGVNRTLEADIDRQSGSLYDLYDYVIFKNQ